jgi:hydrogenase maturation protease
MVIPNFLSYFRLLNVMDLEASISRLKKNLYQLLEKAPKLLILGIGENRMGDDGAGQYLAFYLDQAIDISKIKIINGGIVPEENLDEIVAFQPDIMLLIDTIQGNRLPGEFDIYEDKQMMNYLPISSHSLPLPILIDRCKRQIPDLKVKLLGIEPYSLEFLDRYVLFKEEEYSLDDKEQNTNIPFYAFNLSENMEKICNQLVELFQSIIRDIY